MRLSRALSPIPNLWWTLRVSFIPLLRTLLSQPRLLLDPAKMKDLFFEITWRPMGEGIDEGTSELKKELITPNAEGVVLDIGAGHGHVLKYLDHARVTKYVALEPNEGMHEQLRATAASFGYTSVKNTFVLLPYGAEDIAQISAALKAADVVPVGGIDTIISILSFCSVPRASMNVPALIRQVLRPGTGTSDEEGNGDGGKLLFYEHVRSARRDVQWWQDAWIPIWKIFLGGCLVGQPTDDWIDAMDCWKVKDRRGMPDEEESLFPHSVGRYIRA